MRKDATTDLEKELLDALAHLAEQADEDLPHDLRSEHFNTALEDALIVLFPEEGE